jgi:hypothetical protein
MNKVSPIHRRGIFYRACRLSAIVLGIVLLAILVIRPAEPRVVILDLVSPFIDGFAAFGLFLAARSAYVNSKRLAFAWGTLGLSFFFYAIGDIIWAILEVGLRQQPFPSLADAFYLAYYPAFLAGVFLLQGRLAKPSAWINKAIDGTIIILASTVAYWNFLIGPAVLANAGSPFLEQFILVAFPVGDLVLLAALLVILYNRSSTQDDRAIFLLAGSLVATIAGDSIYGYQSSMGTYASV